MGRLLKSASIFLILASGAAYAAAPVRLATEVVPVAYALEFWLQPDSSAFHGRVAIDIDVRRGVSRILLNASELNVASATLEPEGGHPLALKVSFEDEVLTLDPGRSVEPGRARLLISYSGSVSTSRTDGLFRQKQDDRWYLFSKFEPVTARRAFPCFDQPEFKTPWMITVHAPSGLGVFSNELTVARNEEGGGMQVVRFAPTKPLPSYLVAIAAGPFDVVDAGTAGRNHVPLRIIVPKGRAEEAASARELTPQVVARLEEYFGMTYPYSKLDQIAIPITTQFGAMENAAFIAYGQTSLLVRSGEDTPARLRSRASVMLHETAHQWFGNMVTMRWWDDIWLNEGFASWMAQKLEERWRPQWSTGIETITSRTSILTDEGLPSARRVRQPVVDRSDIAGAFDGITYQKGSALLRMFEDFAGPEVFQRGVREYLRKHAWGAVTSQDFLDSLGAVAGKDIPGAFASFLDQSGAPLVRSKLECGARGSELRVRQERFVPLGTPASPLDRLWRIPVCVSYGAGGRTDRQCVLLADREAPIALKGGCPEWAFADAGASGYYVAMYDSDLNRKLMANGWESLEASGKASLAGSVAVAVNAGLMPAGEALQLAARLAQEADPELIYWGASLAQSMEPYIPEAAELSYARYLRQWFQPMADKLGWDPRPDESVQKRLLRPSILYLAGGPGSDPVTTAEAERRTRMWLRNPRSVSPDTATTALSIAAQHGGRKLFDEFVAALRATQDRDTRSRIVTALASFRDPALARRALDLLLNPGFDPRELQTLLFPRYAPISSVPWLFVQAHFDALSQRLPGARGVPASVLFPYSASLLCDTESQLAVRRFFTERLPKSELATRNTAQVTERIGQCAAKAPAMRQQIAAYLSSQSSRIVQ